MATTTISTKGQVVETRQGVLRDPGPAKTIEKKEAANAEETRRRATPIASIAAR